MKHLYFILLSGLMFATVLAAQPVELLLNRSFEELDEKGLPRYWGVARLEAINHSSSDVAAVHIGCP